MSKQKFIEVVESLFQIHPVDAGAVEYFNKTVKSKKLNQKEIEKARVVKEAIVKYLTINAGKMFDRTEIANALYNAGDFKEEYLINDKGKKVPGRTYYELLGLDFMVDQKLKSSISL